MAITELVTGGFGDLGQAAGAGLNEYTTQTDYDKLAQYVDSLFKQGVSPQQAVQLVNQRFPGAAQGGGSASPGVGSLPAAPRPNVPGINQPNVVPQTIGPSSQMQTPGGFGTLGAPQQAPQQAAPAPMGAQSARGPVDNSMLQTSPGRPPPQMQLAQENPPQAESYAQGRPQNRMQQTSAAPSQAPQQPSMAGVITPRNMPLAQLLLQQRQAQAAQQTEMAKANATNDLRQSIEGMKEQGRNARAGANIASRESIAQLNAGVKAELGQVKNDTDVLRILTNRKNILDALGTKAELEGNDLEFRREKSESDNGVLKTLAGVYQASMAAAANMPAAERKTAEERARLLYERGVDAVTGMRITGGETVTEPTPGIFGTDIGAGTKKTTTPMGVEGPTKPPGTGKKAGERTIIKTETNRRTGQKRYTYSDGTTEVK